MEIVVLAGGQTTRHFAKLEEHFQGRFIYDENNDPRSILKYNPDLVICFDEHYCTLGYAISQVKAAGVATLQIMDGILEWRRTWDYERQGHKVDGVVNPINQPVISHKIACLGKRDAAILESWGNFGKCEIVGAPRLDHLVTKRMSQAAPRAQATERKPRVLVMTAKTAGFTPAQLQTTKRSLDDLKAYFQSRDDIDVVWRVTQGISAELGIRNTLTDLAGSELHTLLENVDAVITTPSTSMLESMLARCPVALLDYHNTPHYFEAAWGIYGQGNIDSVVNELLDPPPPKLDYQEYLLHEQLACTSPAADRLIQLIDRMLAIKRESKGRVLEFPMRILASSGTDVAYQLPLLQLKRYYPQFPVADEDGLREMKLELSAAHGTISMLYDQVEILTKRLHAIPGYLLLKKLSRAFRK
jgi:hypothetical protein